MSKALKGVHKLIGKLGAPVLSQGITALTSLLLQVLAARLLGLAGYGAFAVYLAVLVSATALYTGYVGDSLAVLDRHEPRKRAALVTSALIGLVLAAIAGVITAVILQPGDWSAAVLYAVMLVGWLIEETFRRLLIARQEFWKLVVNDTSYMVGTAVALGVWWVSSNSLSLSVLFACMGVGALTAIVVGLVQVPRSELSALKPGFAGFGEVASFATWRSLHATLRPAAQLAARILVANLISLTAVGLLEAGRLVVAPLQVVVNGAGSFLLAGFAASERKGERGDRNLASRAAWLLTAVTVGGGLVFALLAGPLGRLLAGQPVNPVLLLGWVAYLGIWAAGLPYVTEVTARKLSRSVFWVRLIDSIIGLALVALALFLDMSVLVVPWLMAVGGLYSFLILRSLAFKTRQSNPGEAISA